MGGHTRLGTELDVLATSDAGAAVDRRRRAARNWLRVDDRPSELGDLESLRPRDHEALEAYRELPKLAVGTQGAHADAVVRINSAVGRWLWRYERDQGKDAQGRLPAVKKLTGQPEG